MIANRIEVVRVVDSCYSNSYKVFTINSKNGYELGRSIGLFVSLGITTSLATMTSVMNSLKEVFREDINISEIESRLVNGRYLNAVLNENVTYQYDSGSYSTGKVISEKESYELLRKLISKISVESDIKELSKELSKAEKLSRILDKFRTGTLNWNEYLIYLIDSDSEFTISVVSNLVNYTQYKETINNSLVTVHKRIGILIKYRNN